MTVHFSIVVDVFSQENQAQKALDELRQAGFGYDQVGVAMHGHEGNSLFNDLLKLGISEEHASYYTQEVKVGHTVISVRADGREQEAHDIMRRCGAYDLLRSTKDYDSYDASQASETSTPDAMPVFSAPSASKTQPVDTIQTPEQEATAINVPEDVEQTDSFQADDIQLPIATNQVQQEADDVQYDPMIAVIGEELDVAPLTQDDGELEQPLLSVEIDDMPSSQDEEMIAVLVSEQSVSAEMAPPQIQPEMPRNSKKVRNGLLLGGVLLGLGGGVLVSVLQRENIRMFVLSVLKMLKKQTNDINKRVRAISR